MHECFDVADRQRNRRTRHTFNCVVTWKHQALLVGRLDQEIYREHLKLEIKLCLVQRVFLMTRTCSQEEADIIKSKKQAKTY